MGQGGDLLNLGLSGLLASRRGLVTSSHNISNVNTEGYSRQRVEYASREPVPAANGFIGTGVKVTTVLRSYDRFLTEQVRDNSSSHAEFEEYAGLAGRLDSLLADAEAGLSPNIQRFFNSMEEVANDPASVDTRNVMLAEANALADRFHTMQFRFDDLHNNVNNNLTAVVEDVNGIAEAIATVNQDIVIAGGQSGGQPPNDLLDRRDQLLNELSANVTVKTLPLADGSMNVFVGNGQPLVIGSSYNTLSLENGSLDINRKEIGISIGGLTSIVTDSMNGGKLGGFLRFRDEMLVPAQNQMGRIANALADVFNSQHRAGMTMNATLGGDFFQAGAPQVLSHNNNGGTGTVAVSISDVSALSTADYNMTYDGTNYILTNLSDNTSQTLSGAGPFSTDGLTITIAGAPLTGDNFEIQPNRNGSQAFDVVISDVREIAAAAPIRTQAALANIGAAEIDAGQVLDATDPNLLSTTTIQFLTPATYSVNGVGSFAYTSGGNIDINGSRVVINGTPAVGDSFTIESNAGGLGDNRNALALTALQNQEVIAGNTATVFDAYDQIVSSVGTTTRQLNVNTSAQDVILQQSIDAREGVSGVNLDEEGANLVRLQQSYSAAAQVISVADTIFQTLLQAVAR